MGVFVSVYNYLGFRLEASPFLLPHTVIAFIFMMYAIGIAGSFIAAPMAVRMGMFRTLCLMALLSLAGVLLIADGRLFVIILGLALLTFGFFGAHTVASSWAGTRMPGNRAIASSMYLLVYYIGSSTLGTFSGVAMHGYGWAGLVWLLGIAMAVGVVLVLTLVPDKKK